MNSLLKKGMITPAGFVKTFRNYARTFAPCMTEEEYAQLQLRDTTIQDPALVAPFLSAMIDTADDPASMIDELIAMLQKKREKLAAKKPNMTDKTEGRAHHRSAFCFVMI